MEFFVKTIQQWKQQYGQLTGGSRITVLFLAALLFFGTAYLIVGGLPAQGHVDLFGRNDLDSVTLQRVENALGKSGLEFEVEGDRIRVPAANKHEYFAALAAENALPSNFGDIFSETSQSGSSFSLIPQSQRDYMNRVRSIAILQKVILEMDIEDASVWYDDAAQSGLSRERIHTARADVRPKRGEPLDQRRAEAICYSIIGTFAGIQKKDITVVDLNTCTTFRWNEAGMIDAPGGGIQSTNEAADTYWKQKIEMLVGIPGAIVQTSVELNEYTSRSETEVARASSATPTGPTYNTPQRAPVSRQTPTPETYVPMTHGSPQREASDCLPRPRIQPTSLVTTNKPIETPAPPSLPTEDASDRTIETEYAGLTVRSVRVSIQVPFDYIERSWENARRLDSSVSAPALNANGESASSDHAIDSEAFQSYSERLLETVRLQVANILPSTDEFRTPEDKLSLVHVAVKHDVVAIEAPQATSAQRASVWLAGHWRPVGGGALALTSLCLLSFMLRRRGDRATRNKRRRVSASFAEESRSTPAPRDKEKYVPRRRESRPAPAATAASQAVDAPPLRRAASSTEERVDQQEDHNFWKVNFPSFEEFIEWNDRDVRTVLSEADSRIVMLALAGAPESFIDRLAEGLSEKDARRFKRQLHYLPPTNLREIEQAKIQLLRLAGRMAEDNQLSDLATAGTH